MPKRYRDAGPADFQPTQAGSLAGPLRAPLASQESARAPRDVVRYVERFSDFPCLDRATVVADRGNELRELLERNEATRDLVVDGGLLRAELVVHQFVRERGVAFCARESWIENDSGAVAARPVHATAERVGQLAKAEHDVTAFAQRPPRVPTETIRH